MIAPARAHASPWTAFGLLLVALAGCGHAPSALDPAEEAPVDPIQDVEGSRLFQTGLGLAQAGDLTRAEQYVAASMTRGYPEARALPVLLRICVAASRYRIALGYTDSYLRRNPRDWSLRLLVASIRLGMGDAVAARRELEQVIRIAPEQPEPHYLMAVILRDEVGDVPSATVHFRRYLALAPDGRYAAEVMDALARLQVELPREREGPAQHATAETSTQGVSEAAGSAGAVSSRPGGVEP